MCFSAGRTVHCVTVNHVCLHVCVSKCAGLRCMLCHREPCVCCVGTDSELSHGHVCVLVHEATGCALIHSEFCVCVYWYWPSIQSQ